MTIVITGKFGWHRKTAVCTGFSGCKLHRKLSIGQMYNTTYSARYPNMDEQVMSQQCEKLVNVEGDINE